MRVVLLYIFLPLVILLLAFYWWAQGGITNEENLHTEVKLSGTGIKFQDTVSVMTYNIGYLSGMTNNLPVKPSIELFDINLKKAKALIAKWKPDLIGFQEIDFSSSRSYNRNQIDSLSSGYQYAVNSVNWNKRYVPFPYWPPTVHFGRMLSGQSILSRYPVTRSQRIVLSAPQSAPFYYKAFYLDRLIQLAEVNINNQAVIILNVHLEAFDQQTREIQAGEVLNVVDQYANKLPLLLIGDFNARPPFAREIINKEETISMFLEHPLLSQALDKQQYLTNETQHFTYDSGNPYEKLDYIFYTHETIKPVRVATLTEAGEISDHFPVYMSFTLLNH